MPWPLAGAPGGCNSVRMRRLLGACLVVAFICLALGLVILAPAAVAQDDDEPETDDQIVLTGRLS
jgi:peptidoglycan/LPS O-acetylase OafA/YrhL